MPSITLPSGLTPERIREALGRRAMAVVLVVLIEALLLFLLLALNQTSEEERVVVPMSTFTLSPASQDTPPAAEPSSPDSQQASPPEPQPEQPRPDETPVARIPPPLVQFTRERPAMPETADVPVRRPTPAPANGETMGPPAPRARRGSGDSQRVEGSGPNGEPLYGASWYREPAPEELRGYLSTARGPGWGLIMCQTMPEYRVDNCELVDEYPRGSNIGRAVLAATWQFRVRPPRIGGESQVGAWVRIRIDYDLRRQ